jgi:hypothetical protein
MTRLLRLAPRAGTAVGACLTLVALIGASPAMAGGGHFYDHSYYRPVHGHARNIFHNPVGKLDTTITKRLPSLTVKPTEFDFGVRETKLTAPESAAAATRRANRAKAGTPVDATPKTSP